MVKGSWLPLERADLRRGRGRRASRGVCCTDSGVAHCHSMMPEFDEGVTLDAAFLSRGDTVHIPKGVCRTSQSKGRQEIIFEREKILISLTFPPSDNCHDAPSLPVERLRFCSGVVPTAARGMSEPVQLQQEVSHPVFDDYVIVPYFSDTSN